MSYEWAFELAKRDAEIERLEDQKERLFLKLEQRDTEIERLKDDAKIQALQIDQLIEHEQKALLPLIRELADALDEEHVSRPREYHPVDCPYCWLMKRAREL